MINIFSKYLKTIMPNREWLGHGILQTEISPNVLNKTEQNAPVSLLLFNLVHQHWFHLWQK